MTRFVPQRLKARQSALATPKAATVPLAAFDLDALLPRLREVWVQVPCGGCGGAHEMSCAELLTRQVLRGASFPSEECDDGAVLGAILSPEEAATLGGDVEAICAALERRGVLCTSRPDADADGTFSPGHEPRHILLAH